MAKSRRGEINVDGFAGLNELLSPYDLGDDSDENWLVKADNIDIDDGGSIKRRAGTQKIAQFTNPHSLWSDGNITLFVENGNLRIMNSFGVIPEVSAAAASSLAALVQAAAGESDTELSGFIAQDLPTLNQSMSANLTVSAEAAQVLAALSQVAGGNSIYSGTMTQSLSAMAQSAEGAAASTLNDDIVAFWKLDEASGTRVDEVGSNDLTDTNTVTQAVGKVGNAAQFTAANVEFLSIADNADVSMGDIDFEFAFWVYLDSKSDIRALISQRANTTKFAYEVVYIDTSDRFKLDVSSDGGVSAGLSTVSADTLGSPSLDTWYCIFCYHDSVNNEIGIRVNDGAFDTAAHSGGVFDSDQPFYLGRSGGNTKFPHDGRMDAVGLWKNRILTSAERTEFYNGGAGKEYPF